MTTAQRRPPHLRLGLSVLAALGALGALHDIGDITEPDLVLEYAVLAVCVAWFVYVAAIAYRGARARRPAPQASR